MIHRCDIHHKSMPSPDKKPNGVCHHNDHPVGHGAVILDRNMRVINGDMVVPHSSILSTSPDNNYKSHVISVKTQQSL